jgi:hygromycin-B 7''-O-kinase
LSKHSAQLDHGEDFSRWRADPLDWSLLALDIARGHGLPCDEIEVFETGTNLVVGLGRDHVLKIYPPFLRRQFTVERITLPRLEYPY